MKVVQEEIFGPVVTAMPFQDLDSLVPMANDSAYGLAAGIWTRDIAKAHQIAEELRAGTVWINCYNIFDAALPFGGYKQSGWGREMGEEALRLYTETKAVCARYAYIECTKEPRPEQDGVFDLRFAVAVTYTIPTTTAVRSSC